jgi:DNA replication protein DnaC
MSTSLWGRHGLMEGARNHAIRAIEQDRAPEWEFWGVCCPTCSEERPAQNVYGAVCSCERKRRDELIAAFVAERLPKHVPGAIEKASIPRRYEGCTFDSFTKRNGTADALAATKAWADAFELDTERGLFLTGPFGSGKTHLAVAALRRAIQRTLVDGRYLSAGALVGAVRSGERISWAPVEDATRAELLVLDDLGQEAGTEFTRDIVARVLFGRYEAARPTIVTSNLGPKAVGNMFGGAVLSRLHEMAEPLAMTASDYRTQGRGT